MKTVKYVGYIRHGVLLELKQKPSTDGGQTRSSVDSKKASAVRFKEHKA